MCFFIYFCGGFVKSSPPFFMFSFRVAVWMDGKMFYGGYINANNWKTAELIIVKVQNDLKKDGFNVKLEIEDFYENSPSNIISNHNNLKLSYYMKFYFLSYKEETEEMEIIDLISFFRDIEDYEKCAYLKNNYL